MGQTDFPKYRMTIRTKVKFCTLREAAEAISARDSGFRGIGFGNEVLAEDFSIREFTRADELLIAAVADALRRKK